MIVFPIFQIFWILFSVLGGLVYFQEYARLQVNQASLFCLAIGVICVGVYFLAQHEAQQVVRKTERVVTTVWVVMALNCFKKRAKQKLLILKRRKKREELPSDEIEIEMVVPVNSKSNEKDEKLERIRKFGQMVQDAVIANDEREMSDAQENVHQHPVIRFLYGLLGAEMNLYHMSSLDGDRYRESGRQTRNVSEDEDSADDHHEDVVMV